MVFNKLVLILIVSVANISIGQTSEIQPFVVNGTDATIEEFPFMASLRYNNRHSCGSTIINELWILTAAHCVIGDPIDLLSVHIESARLDVANPNIIPVELYIIHEKYDQFNQYINDIALIKLQIPINNNLFDWKVKLPTRGLYYPTGTPAVLPGWGRNASDGPVQNILQKVNLQIYSSTDCAERHVPRKIHPSNICGGVEGGYQGQCSGDSGGPLLVRGIQVGIVSWSVKPCTVPPYPGVYTSVAHHIDWIEKHIGFRLNLNAFLSA